MKTFHLGPIALPYSTATALLLFFLCYAFLWALAYTQPKHKRTTELTDLFFYTTVWGLLIARFTFIALYWNSYQQHPWSVFKLADLGFHPLGFAVGVVGYLGYIFYRKRHIKPIVGLLILWIAAGTAFFLLTSPHIHQEREPIVPQVNVYSFPDQQLWSLPSYIQEQQFKGTVINLWATWCPPCRREMPLLAQHQGTWPEIGILLVNQGESPDLIQQYLTVQQLDFQHLFIDEQLELSSYIGIQIYPTTLFFNQSGVLVDSHIGELSLARLQWGIERIHQSQ